MAKKRVNKLAAKGVEELSVAISLTHPVASLSTLGCEQVEIRGAEKKRADEKSEGLVDWKKDKHGRWN